MDWETYIKHRVRAKSGWYYLNADVAAQAESFNGGIYIYTDRRRRSENKYKPGQTFRGQERVFEQGADQDEDMYIVGFIPFDLKQSNYDKKIHKILEDSFNCKIITKESAAVATEWIEYPADVDPVSTTMSAIQQEQQNPHVGRIELKLTLSQIKALDKALNQFSTGDTLLAEHCPRFGKTVWAIALFDHLGSDVMVVGSYVLSALNSYRTDLVRFTQFEHIALADSLEKVLENRKKGLKSLITVSLHDRFDAWKKKYGWIQELDSKLIIIDEADFGAHTPAQVKKVNVLRSNNQNSVQAKMSLMTGTAGDRAVGSHIIDSYISTTYVDMLVDKRSKNPIFESKLILSKYVIAENMDTIPGIKFYQYDYSDLLSQKNELYPSWNKFAAAPAQNGVFPKTVLGECLGTKHATGMLPSIQETIKEPITGIMLFIPRKVGIANGDFTNYVIPQINEVVNEGFYIIGLTGDTTDGNNAEEYTRNEMKKAAALGKIPLIISTGHIGSRSFSIPEINVVLIMYDGGSAATTGQNMSRGSTRGARLDKVAHVFSLSIDRTRDDSMVQAVLETAVKISNETGENIIEATRRVLRAMNVFAINEHGSFASVDIDTYAAKIMSSRSLRGVVGTTSDPTKIMDDPVAVQALLNMSGEKVSLGKAASVGEKGKTFADANAKKAHFDRNDSEQQEALRLYNKIKEAMKLIADNAQNIAAIGGTDKLTTSIETIVTDQTLNQLFLDSFNVEAEFVKTLIDCKAVNGKLLDLVVYTYSKEQQEEADKLLQEFV